MPPALAAVVEAHGALIAPLVLHAATRAGWLEGRPGAAAWVAERLQPFDVIVVSSKQYAWARTQPGYFTHAAVYLGTAAQLRAAGLWDDPRLDPWREAVAGGATVVEASGEAVALVPLEKLLRADAVAILRPPRGDGSGRLGALLGTLGRPFDLHFDARDPAALFCTELVAAAMPDLALAPREVYGRPTIIPDEIVADALRGRNGLRLAGFVAGREGGWFTGSPELVAATVGRHWPAGGRGKAGACRGT